MLLNFKRWGSSARVETPAGVVPCRASEDRPFKEYRSTVSSRQRGAANLRLTLEYVLLSPAFSKHNQPVLPHVPGRELPPGIFDGDIVHIDPATEHETRGFTAGAREVGVDEPLHQRLLFQLLPRHGGRRHVRQ